MFGPRILFQLKIKTGSASGQVFDLTQNEIILGRSEGSQIILNDQSVSRRHARFTFKEGSFYIDDLGSVNGTYVNGQRIGGSHRLFPGDSIKLGADILLEFSAQNIPGSEPMAPLTPGASAYPGQVAHSPAIPKTVLFDDQAAQFASLQAASARLVVTIAGEPPQIYPLTKPQISIGRSPDNDIVIDSEIVSRHHARLEKVTNQYRLVILPGTTNETHLSGRLVSQSIDLKHNDIIRIGSQTAGLMVTLAYLSPADQTAEKPLNIMFGTRSKLQIGRDAENDVVLDAPMISRYHAQIERVGQRYRIKDLRSSNGVHVNDQRIEGEVWLKPGDVVRIGPYRFLVGQDQLAQYDETGGLGVDAFGLNKWVRKDLNLLKDISLTFQPRELVVVVGQSGGGKTTLVDAIAGYRPASGGEVYIKGIDVYKSYDSIRNHIGYVPQRDIIHMELTVYQALDYAAKLRMPMDTTPAERHKRIMEVLDDLDLAQRKDLQVSRLSGGQQKRVSIGVELLTKPGLFFLDEPTSGLDPGTETIFMQLMRRLADQGRTIVLVTHATKNVMLADKVVFLARGGYLAWFGPPDEALRYFDQYRSEREQRTSTMEFDLIYNILEDSSRGNPQQWAERFQAHPAYQQYIVQPLQQSKQKILSSHQRVSERGEPARAIKGFASFFATRFHNLIEAVRQFFILSARNLRIISRDRAGLFLMLAVAPLVGLLDLILAGAMGSAPFDYQDGDFTNTTTSLFILVIYGVLVGGLSQMREIVKEQAIYKRERMVNIQILPYVSSKMWVAALLALYHAAAYLILHYIGFTMPGGWIVFGLSYITIVLSTYAGMMLGLFASALAPNANSVPLILILLMVPQIVLAGALVPLPGTITSVISARWAFEALMGITGPGSDVAADPCWALPEEEREALTNEDKEALGCRCMGVLVFNRTSCEFPGLGPFYDPAIDQPEPIEPAEVGDPPEKPVLPAQPVEPANKNDSQAMAVYMEELKDYQTTADQIQSDYQKEVDAYQELVDQYQEDLIDYQEAYADWEISRNAAISQAEGTIDRFQERYGWTSVNKEDTPAFWEKIGKAWLAQGLIITVLFFLILVSMKRKDKAA